MNAQLLQQKNLEDLMFAQHLIKTDKIAAGYYIGANQTIADKIERLTPPQMRQLSGAGILLFGLRFGSSTAIHDMIDKYAENDNTALTGAMLQTAHAKSLIHAE